MGQDVMLYKENKEQAVSVIDLDAFLHLRVSVLRCALLQDSAAVW